MINLLFDPFIYHGFMRRALIVCLALSLSSVPIGLLLILRRMSLISDALSHAMLPGLAISYIFFGTSMVAMSISGFITGLLVLILSEWIKSITFLEEDTSLACFYIGFLSLGVIILSLRGQTSDLIYFLFGSILTINLNNVKYIGIITSFTILILTLFYRILIIEIFDSTFFKVSFNIIITYFIKFIFLMLVVLNLIAGFQTLGTLMSIGIMVLPGAIARCWTNNLSKMFILAFLINIFSSWFGLLGAFYASLPAGPIIVLCSSIIFLISILLKNKNKFI